MVAFDFRVKRVRFGVGSLLVFWLLGAVFTSTGLFVFQSAQTDRTWVRVEGEVVDVLRKTANDGSILYTPIVEYEVNGQTYRVAGNLSSSVYPVIGSKRPVAYNPARPDQSKVVVGFGAKLFLLIFPVIGILGLVLGPILFIKSFMRSREIQRLRQTGNKLTGVLVDLQVTGLRGGRGRGPYL